MNLAGKTAVIGVTGGIAAYKAAQLVSDLVKTGCAVHVIMTKNAAQFVSPLTFETLSGNRAITDTFDRSFQWNVQHVALAKKADVLAVVPATANVIGKFANGIADDMLTTTLLAVRCPVLIAPAMNTAMYDSAPVKRNIETLKNDGVHIIEPDSGYLACGDTGAGRLAEIPRILEAIAAEIACEKDMKGVRVLVTAGPTREELDPVRYLTNHSSGKMGYELARAALHRGARVTLVTGPSSLQSPYGADVIPVSSALEMFEAVKNNQGNADIIVMAAAVVDYTPSQVSQEKIKKSGEDLVLNLMRTDDILKWLGENRTESQILCGFAMETSDLEENAVKKLKLKKADMIVANSLRDEGAGFGTDTNVAMLITGCGVEKLPLMTKSELSHRILHRLLEMKH